MIGTTKLVPVRRGGVVPAMVMGACLLVVGLAPAAVADRLHLKGGGVIQADEVWEDASGYWYRRNGVTEFVARDRVSRLERDAVTPQAPPSVNEIAQPAAPTGEPGLWIYLAGGARMEVEEVTQTADGYWYRRGQVSMFLDRARVERVERGEPEVGLAAVGAARHVSWTTGRPALDRLIHDNGARFGVDPYLIFCVMEQESHFNQRAVSPKGARGLMQLMPGTARRFGVRDVHDPAQNIAGGTRYLRELLQMFGGRVDLALASYNAGEGAVMRYGKTVPPYRETQNYVRRIGARYGKGPGTRPGAAENRTEKVSP